MKRIAILTTAGAFLLGFTACTAQQQANFDRGMQAAAFGMAYGAMNRPVYVAPVYSMETTCTQVGMFTNCRTW